MRYIVSRNYRGNVRELENLVERAVTLALDGRVELGDLDYEPAAQAGGPRLPWIELPDSGFDLDGYLAEIERRVLVAALERTHGVRKDAAKLLGTTFRSMRYRLGKYGLGDAEDDVEAGDSEGVAQHDGERRSEP
jgi:two-component system response regulator PilR (NtrC family)